MNKESINDGSRTTSQRNGSCLNAACTMPRHKGTKKSRYIKPQAVKDLEDAYTIYHYLRFSNIPPDSRVKMKFRDDTANGLTKCIICYLKMKGCQAERINTTGLPVDNRKTVTDVVGITRVCGSLSWRPTTATRGSADISATVKGRSVKIEVKIGSDRQSEYQRRYQRDVEDAGGIYYIAHDFTSFVGFTKSLGL